jgi:hypothetical protein
MGSTFIIYVYYRANGQKGTNEGSGKDETVHGIHR